MKQAFRDKHEVAHNWANQTQAHGGDSGNRIYFDCEVLYSYRAKIAVIYKEHYALITHRKYSQTTSSHISAAHSAASHKTIIECSDPYAASKGEHKANVDDYINQILFIGAKLLNARKPENYLHDIDNVKKEMHQYLELFEITLSESQKAQIEFTNREEYVESVAKANEIAEKERKARLKKGKAFYNKWSAEWRKGEEIKLSTKDAALKREYEENQNSLELS